MGIHGFKFCMSHFVYRYRKHSIKEFHDTELPVYGLYHILCINNWQNLMKRQIDHLVLSGLYDRMNCLFISAIVSQDNDLVDIEAIGGEKCKVIAINTDANVYEYPALQYIWNRANDEDFYFFYFHSKGISYEKSNVADYEEFNYLNLKACVKRWREMMEYFIFDRYKDAISALFDNNTYGCCFTIDEYNSKFFSGNFWWAKSSYVRTIPQISEENSKRRFFAEQWICSCSDKNFSQFDININPYLSIVPEKYYRNDKPLVVSEMFKSIFMHYQFWIGEVIRRIRKAPYLKFHK